MTTRAINEETFLSSPELTRLRAALASCKMSERRARRITMPVRTLANRSGLLVAEVLARAGSADRDRVVAALRALEFVLTPGAPSRSAIAPPARRRGRPRALRCCLGPARTFGGSMTDWPSGACIDDVDARYRYTLWRRTSIAQPMAAFILKNPSTADQAKNDPSALNCSRSAAKVGLGAELVNIYPWRGDILSLLAAGDAREGDYERNIEHIRQAIRRAKMVVLGFGDFDGPLRALRPDVTRIRDLIEQERQHGYARELFALRITATGAPWHPARLGGAPVPIPYNAWPTWLDFQ